MRRLGTCCGREAAPASASVVLVTFGKTAFGMHPSQHVAATRNGVSFGTMHTLCQRRASTAPACAFALLLARQHTCDGDRMAVGLMLVCRAPHVHVSEVRNRHADHERLGLLEYTYTALPYCHIQAERNCIVFAAVFMQGFCNVSEYFPFRITALGIAYLLSFCNFDLIWTSALSLTYGHTQMYSKT